MIGSFGWMELLLILFIVLIIFGAGKIPQLGEGLGKAIKGFKKSINESDAMDVTPQEEGMDATAPPPPAAAAWPDHGAGHGANRRRPPGRGTGTTGRTGATARSAGSGNQAGVAPRQRDWGERCSAWVEWKF